MPSSKRTRNSPLKQSLAQQLLNSVNEAHALLAQSLSALSESQRQIRLILEVKYERPVISTEQAQQQPTTATADPETLSDTTDYGEEGDAAQIAKEGKLAVLSEESLEAEFVSLAREQAASHPEAQA